MKIIVITFNIRHGEIKDKVLDPVKQAQTIKMYSPDILVLQEVDLYTDRAKGLNELEIFRQEVGMEYCCYGANITFEHGWYGNAILSKFPMISSENYISSKTKKEVKGVLHARIKVLDKEVDIYNTHMPVEEKERIEFVDEFISMFEKAEGKEDRIFVGDFNLGIIPLGKHQYRIEPKEEYVEIKKLEKYFTNAKFDEFTWLVDDPQGSIDKFMYHGNIKVEKIERINETISDHYPVKIECEMG